MTSAFAILVATGFLLLVGLLWLLFRLVPEAEPIDAEAETRKVLDEVRRIEVMTRHIVNEVFAGEYHSAFQGQGMEFQEVREYVPGDDIRSIDWNVTARMNAPFIKKFREERELTLMLVCDLSESLSFGSGEKSKRKVAAEIAAVLAFAAIKNNDKVGLLLHTDRVEKYIAPEKGARHVLRVVKEVLSAEAEGTGTDFGPALQYLDRVTHRKAIVVVISDFMTEVDNFKKVFGRVGRRHDAAAIFIGDTLEKTWPKAGIFEFEDTETGKRITADLGDRHTRERLEKQADGMQRTALREVKRCGFDTVEIEANQSYDVALMRFFTSRARRVHG